MAFKILIVDDDSQVREAMRDGLELEGYEIDECTGGNEVLGFLKKKQVDLIISDVRMPNGDGISLLKNLKNSEFKNIPMFLISGFADFSGKDIKQLGGENLINKPVTLDDLITHIKSYQK